MNRMSTKREVKETDQHFDWPLTVSFVVSIQVFKERF